MQAIIAVLILLLVVSITLFIKFVTKNIFRYILVKEGQFVVLLKNGKFSRILNPGLNPIWIIFTNIDTFIYSSLPQLATIPVQEIITKDQIDVRVSLVFEYEIKNLESLYLKYGINYYNFIYSEAQLALRNKVSEIEVEEISKNLSEISEAVFTQLKDFGNKIGIEVSKVNVKDITFPKNVQDILYAKFKARIEAQAKLEQARGEVAANRALINAAQIIKEHPEVKILREIQAQEKSGSLTLLNKTN